MLDTEKVKALRNGTAEKKGGYWSSQEKEELKRMFFEQVGITEMALAFKRSEKAIMNQLDKLGVYERVRAANKPKDGCLCSQCSLQETCKGKGKLCDKSS